MESAEGPKNVGQEQSTVTQKQDNKAQESKALIDRMYEAMNQNKVGVMKEFWTDDMAWRGPAGVGTHIGVEAFEQNVRAPFIRAFPDKNGYDEVRLAEGNFVAGTGYQHTTFAQDWLGIRATCTPIKVRYMDFWRVEGDKIAENWVLIDILGVLEQAGYNVEKVLKFVGSKPPGFFESSDLLDTSEPLDNAQLLDNPKLFDYAKPDEEA